MPIYAKLGPYDPVFVGGVTVGAHAGWSRLQTFEFGLARPAGGPQAAQGSGAPSLNEILVTKETDVGSESCSRSGAGTR